MKMQVLIIVRDVKTMKFEKEPLDNRLALLYSNNCKGVNM